MLRKLFYLCAAFGIISLASCEKSTETEQVIIEENTVPDYSAGEAVFLNHCVECHQENGEGIPGAFPSLTGRSADANTIMNGVEGTMMAAFKDSLNDEQIADLVNYICHSWGNHFPDIDTKTVSKYR